MTDNIGVRWALVYEARRAYTMHAKDHVKGPCADRSATPNWSVPGRHPKIIPSNKILKHFDTFLS